MALTTLEGESAIGRPAQFHQIHNRLAASTPSWMTALTVVSSMRPFDRDAVSDLVLAWLVRFAGWRAENL
jgi:hypothetical protein